MRRPTYKKEDMKNEGHYFCFQCNKKVPWHYLHGADGFPDLSIPTIDSNGVVRIFCNLKCYGEHNPNSEFFPKGESG